MPALNTIISLNYLKNIRVLDHAEKHITGVYERIPDVCPHCNLNSGFRVKEHSERRFAHTLVGGTALWVRVAIRKWFCKQCRRVFSDRLPGVKPRKRASERFRDEIFEQHEHGLNKQTLARTSGFTSPTIERWYHDHLVLRMKELSNRKCPMVLGIDEHFFSRKNGFATTFVDLKNNKVFDVVLGRSESSLSNYLKKLKNRDRVRVIVMDLSETYRAIAKKYFPNAVIVTDRFHVVRVMNHHFLQTWKLLDEPGYKNRGLMSLMRRKPDNLSADQKINLEKYLDKIPGLKSIYDFKQDLHQLLSLKTVSKAEAKQKIPQFIWHVDELIGSPFESLSRLGRTLHYWREGIVRMWRFSKNNGITEGFHTKMELISRRAYGFRNFQNYRIRVIALCGWNGLKARRSKINMHRKKRMPTLKL